MTRYKFDDIEVSEKFQKGYNALEGILNCLKPADMYIVQASDIINPDPELGYICHVVTDSFIKELEEELDKLRVFTQVSNKFIDTCETPFFNRCEDKTSKSISNYARCN